MVTPLIEILREHLASSSTGENARAN